MFLVLRRFRIDADKCFDKGPKERPTILRRVDMNLVASVTVLATTVTDRFMFVTPPPSDDSQPSAADPGSARSAVIRHLLFVRKIIVLLAVLLWANGLSLPASEKPLLDWTSGRLPKLNGAENPGVARPFAGISQGVAILAGGANFSEKPLIEGGKKQYHSTIYILPPGTRDWKVVGDLPAPLAEGVSVTTSRGIVCVGGTDGNGDTSKAFLMNWDPGTQTVRIDPLPDYPKTFRMGAAAVWNRDTVYVLGGLCDGSVSGEVYRLRLNHLPAGWEAMPPIPTPRDQPVAAVQNTDQKRTALFVFGGYAPDENGCQFALMDGFSYDLAQGREGRWVPTAEAALDSDPDRALSLIGASALPIGTQHIFFFGGVNRNTWDEAQVKFKTLRGDELEQFRHDYFSAPAETLGWNRYVLAYHTVTNTWLSYGTVPFLPRAGAAVLRLQDGSLLVASGEIKGGVRTASCEYATFTDKGAFTTLDWGVLIGYFSLTFAIGVVFLFRNKTGDDYFLAGGRLPWWLAGVAIFATMLSSITFLSVPAMTYISDWRYVFIPINILILAPIVIRFYLPFYRRLRVASAYEYLERRFNLPCRLFASAAFCVFIVCRTAIVIYLPAIALAAVTSMHVETCIFLVAGITIVYSTLGGVEAVAWNDLIQGAVLMGGGLLVLIVLIAKTDGGTAGFVEIASQAGKLKLLDLRFTLYEPVFWIVIASGFIVNLSSYTSDQVVIQRYMSTPDEKAAARGIWFNAVASMFSTVLFFAIGTGLYTYYASRPARFDPLMPTMDSIFPTFIVRELPPGISGLLVAAIFAATMSTIAANMNSCATAITTDFIVRFRDVSQARQLRLGQLFTFLVGIFATGCALYLARANIYSLFDQFQKFLAILTSGLACLFFMGIFTRRIGGIAAMGGLIVNYIVCISLEYSAFSWKPHLLLYAIIGMASCLTTSFLLAAVLKEPRRDLTDLTLYDLDIKKDQESS